MLQYTVLLHKDNAYRGYWVEVPILPGCVSQGKTKAAALKNIKEAIELHIETMREDGENIPIEDSSKISIAV